MHGDQEKVDVLTGELELTGRPLTRTRQAHTFAWHAKALAATGRGDFETAYQNAAASSASACFRPLRAARTAGLPDLVEGAVATGRGAAARAHADAMNRHRLADISPRLALITSSCAAMAADDDHEPRACSIARFRYPLPTAGFLTTTLQLAYAQRLRRIRDSREGRRHLLRAALGPSTPSAPGRGADRAARELRAVGPGRTSPAGGDVTGPGALTHHERKVARRRRRGYRHQQADRRASALVTLHWSIPRPRHRILPKLGITTRAALRDA